MSKGLGRGLSMLLGAEEENTNRSTGSVSSLPVSDLEPSRFQPRRVFNEDAIRDLIESVKVKGILQPLIVRRIPNEAEKYEIIGGERRWRAAQAAGLTEVPVLIKDFSDKEALEVALIENLQRQDLNALEEAEGYRRLMEEFANTQEELAQAVGKSRSHVANTMRLLGLPQPVKELLESGKLTGGHARALLTAKDPVALAEEVVSKGLSVRQTEKLAQKGIPEKKQKKSVDKTNKKNDEWEFLANELSQMLELKVSIRPKAKGGELVVSYASLEELDFIIGRLGNNHAEPEKPAVSEDTIIGSDAVTDDVIQMEKDDVGDVVFDDSFDKNDDVISGQ